MIKILMVCLGNICRSPLAHGILESKLPSDKFYVDSAGTGNYHIEASPDHRSIQVARKHGVNISNQKCRQFQIADFDTFDKIYVMDISNYNTVLQLTRNLEDRSKVKLIGEHSVHKKGIEIPDPYYGDHHDFEYVYSLLDDLCETISKELQT